MTRRSRVSLAAIVGGLVLAAASPELAAEADDAVPLTSETVKERWHARLAGRHFSAKVRLSMDLAGLSEERELLAWRTDESVGAERVLIRFTQPESLRNVGVLFLEQQGRPNDYFLYQPDAGRVRRLPEAIANDDVYGIDLEFLGFGVAQSEPTEVVGMKRERLEGRDTYRLEERAVRENPRFEERITWLDAQTFIPVRTEQRRKGDVRLVARTVEIRPVQGVPTPVRMEFENAHDHRKVSLRVLQVDYEAAIPEDYFAMLALVRSKLKGQGGDKPDVTVR